MTYCDLSVWLTNLRHILQISFEVMGSFPEVLKFNRLFLKLVQFIRKLH